MVVIRDNRLLSIWDIEIEDEQFSKTADLLNDLISNSIIKDVFYHYSVKLGVDKNRQLLPDGEIRIWEHFHVKMPNEFKKREDDIPRTKAGFRDKKHVFYRSLTELTMTAVDQVLGLITEKLIYRGDEYKARVEDFKKELKVFQVIPEQYQDNYAWARSLSAPSRAVTIKNNVIGTLIEDLSKGVALEVAVAKFETKVAPQNYKRNTALITEGQKKKARERFTELGLMGSLGRRHAVAADIEINNTIHVNRDIESDIFGELENTAGVNPRKYDKAEEISIEKFLAEVMPGTVNLKVLLENRHEANLVNLVASTAPEAPQLTKWPSGITWAYGNGFTDTIKEKVKAAGGRVDGVLRTSLSWSYYDDLDLHVKEPNGNHIYYPSRGSQHPSSAMLDVDMNAGGRQSRTPVENIIWTDQRKMQKGTYKVAVNNYTKRESTDVGFEIEIEFLGEVFNFTYDKAVRNGETIQVCEFDYDPATGITFKQKIDSKVQSRDMWSMRTNHFYDVDMFLKSPNHWDGEEGNLHYFFMIKDAKNPEAPRGFFNEFLRADLHAERKVMEALADKMKVAPSDDQLAGIGFSSTIRNYVICQVKGNVNRTYKVTF
jgi:hypothetical protein